METCTVALFGEAEKGEFSIPYYCKSLNQLVDCLGNPPPNSKGLFCAVQALLSNKELLFLRVEEEGFSYLDYSSGLQLLETQLVIPHIAAICLPGVGDPKILQLIIPYCIIHHSILIMNESDLYDYLTVF